MSNKYYEIVDGKIDIIDIKHPLLGKKDKNFFIEKFISDIKPDDSKKYLNFKGEHYNFLSFYKNNKYYIAFIESVDGGGRDIVDKEKRNKKENCSKKISIPYNSVDFKRKIVNFDKILVINIYFPLKKNLENSSKLEIDEKNYYYFIIDPLELYSSDVAKKIINNSGEKINASSRWVKLKDLINFENSKDFSKKENYDFTKNKKDNVFILKNNKLENFFINGPINGLYDSMLKNNINYFSKEMLSNSKTNFELSMNIVSKYRKAFRQYLFSKKDKKCFIKNCDISFEESLIASHIKSVESILKDKNINDKEKIDEIQDSNNGFIFCRNHDFLFDKYYISFDENGNLMCSEYALNFLSQFNLLNDYKYINIDNGIKKYLSFHNKEFDKKWN